MTTNVVFPISAHQTMTQQIGILIFVIIFGIIICRRAFDHYTLHEYVRLVVERPKTINLNRPLLSRM